jgi:hypothetical protein
LLVSDAAEANKKAAEAREGTAKALTDVALANERTGKVELEAAAGLQYFQKTRSPLESGADQRTPTTGSQTT